MRTKLFLQIGLVLGIFSCSNLTEDQKTKQAFKDLENRYSVLITPPDLSYLNYYTLLISAEHHILKMKYKIFRRFSNEERVFILTLEYNNKIAAIPIFPFSRSCFWNYENDSNKCETSKNNFQSEYNRMLKVLNLSDSFRLAGFPFSIITNNILYLQTVQIEDTLSFSKECNYYDKDSLFITTRNRKNVEQLIKLMHPEPNFYVAKGLKDLYSERIFWGSIMKNRKSKFELVFKAFNFECAKMPVYEL